MRQAIIERVAKSCEMESSKGQIRNVLEDSGFFELLEAAEGTYKDFERFGAMDNMGLRLATGYVLSCNRLKDAIARANGDS